MPVPGRTVAQVAEIVERTPEELRAIASIAIITAVGFGIFIWWLIGRIDDGCPSCAHCVDKNKRRQATQAQAAQAQRERLFGVDRSAGGEDEEAARGEEAQGSGEHDEGREEPGSG